MSMKFKKDKFAKDVYYGRYALVIGNESLLNPKIEPTGDVHQFFLRKVNENNNSQFKSYHEIAIDLSEKKNPVRQMIENGEIRFRACDVSEDLRALLETKLFTTVLTTTTDGYLEAAMREVWGNELRVVNVWDKETVDELQKALKACRRGKKYCQPTLIYVFGKLDVDDLAKDYVNSDAMAIKIIEKWMRMNAEANNEMLNFIRQKRLLALGCKYDNWYFRFLWYVLTGVYKSGEENKYDGHGEVAFTLDEADKSESKLREFLNLTDIYFHGDATPFIAEITKLLTEDTDDASCRNQVRAIRNRNGIFISYCSKDAFAARQLFFQLCEMEYDVWLDSERLYGGDNYEHDIDEAISDSKVVITVLSPHVAGDLKSNDTGHYYNKEWRMAQQFKDKTIIPLAINGYDHRASYHKVYDSIINQPLSCINLMEPDGFLKLISAIKDHI